MYVKDNPSSVNTEDRDVMADMAVQLTSMFLTHCRDFSGIGW